MLIEIVAAMGLILPGLLLCEVLGFKHSLGETLGTSYVISTSLMFFVLYLGGIFGVFREASYVLLVIVLASGIGLIIVVIYRREDFRKHIDSLLSKSTLSSLVVPLSAVALLSVYAAVLLQRPILDSDVAQFYLPMAREISSESAITYSTGYDYNILLKPIGAAVMYAWTYVLAGSTSAEAFRLLPLVPVMTLIGLIHEIAKRTTGSNALAGLAAAVFLVIPLHDRLLVSNGFYPDIFYYPLIFTAMMHIMKYTKGRKTSNLIWIGLEIGTASLLKAQSIYILIAIVIVISINDLRNKGMSAIIIALTPFAILLPNLFAESIQRNGFVPSISGMTIGNFLLFSFLALILTTVYYLLFMRQKDPDNASSLPIHRILSRGILLLIPFGLMASLWYLNNWLRFGSLLYTSSIILPNYDWAIALLESSSPPITSIDNALYIGHFGFMFLDPAVVGYIWLIPCLLGIFFVSKRASHEMRTFLILSMTLAVLMFSQVVYAIPEVGTPTYNPRDIVLLAPMLIILITSGIASLSATSTQSFDRVELPSKAFLFVALYGFLSYVHSVVVWFVSVNMPSASLIALMETIVSFFGLSLQQTSYQLGTHQRILFPYEKTMSILLISLTAGIPLLILAVKRFWIRDRNSGRFLNQDFMSLGTDFHFRSQSRKKRLLGLVVSLSVILSVIVVPRATIYLQAGNYAVSDYPLEATYGPLGELISERNLTLDGGILTYMAPDGLPYYLPNNEVIDLRWAANLAALRECLTMPSARESVIELRNRQINYMLIDPSKIQGFDSYLGFRISAIAQDLELSIVIGAYGNWELLKLGPHVLEKLVFPLEAWTVDHRYTDMDYSFTVNSTQLQLRLNASDIETRATIFTTPSMGVAVSEYHVLYVHALSTNARVLIRIIMNDDTYTDSVYWGNLGTQPFHQYRLNGFSSSALMSSIYIGLKSSNLQPCELLLWEISLVRVA